MGNGRTVVAYVINASRDDAVPPMRRQGAPRTSRRAVGGDETNDGRTELHPRLHCASPTPRSPAGRHLRRGFAFALVIVWSRHRRSKPRRRRARAVATRDLTATNGLAADCGVVWACDGKAISWRTGSCHQAADASHPATRCLSANSGSGVDNMLAMFKWPFCATLLNQARSPTAAMTTPINPVWQSIFTGEHPELRRGRKILRLLSPTARERCRMCYAGFDGLSAPFMRAIGQPSGAEIRISARNVKRCLLETSGAL